MRVRSFHSFVFAHTKIIHLNVCKCVVVWTYKVYPPFPSKKKNRWENNTWFLFLAFPDKKFATFHQKPTVSVRPAPRVCGTVVNLKPKQLIQFFRIHSELTFSLFFSHFFEKKTVSKITIFFPTKLRAYLDALGEHAQKGPCVKSKGR